jgi:exosome complex exonuclease RRP6
MYNSEFEPKKPESYANTPFTYVDTVEKLKIVQKKLEKAKEIAVDLEHHSMRSYLGFTCLIQLSTREEDFIIDPLLVPRIAIRDALSGAFSDPSIVKILHGSDYDIKWLQKDFSIYVVRLFDTGQAARILGLKGFGLAHLLKEYCNVNADKKYQMADWRMRPMTKGTFELVIF